MDMSKLPKMSQSPAPPPGDLEPSDSQDQPIDYREAPHPGVGAEAWISIAIGVILMLVTPYTAQWLVSCIVPSYKPPFLPITDAATGAEIPYTQSIFFFSNLCIFLFSLVLIFDGIVLFVQRRAIIAAALLLTVVASVLNGIFVIKAVLNSEGLPLVSALAVAFGIYIALYQWRLLQTKRPVKMNG